MYISNEESISVVKKKYFWILSSEASDWAEMQWEYIFGGCIYSSYEFYHFWHVFYVYFAKTR